MDILFLAVVLFCEKSVTVKLIKAVKSLQLSGDFIWIGPDAWSSRWRDLRGLEDVLLGAVTVEPQAGTIPGFDQYFKVFLCFRHSTSLHL